MKHHHSCTAVPTIDAPISKDKKLPSSFIALRCLLPGIRPIAATREQGRAANPANLLGFSNRASTKRHYISR